jgi:NAD(P)-dependent dehydrogenase (short-subunit alcohol dehydrogenase family)
VQRAVDEFGRVDVLVNSAGILPLGQVLDVTEEGFDEAWRANVKGAFFCGQAAIEQMLRQGNGRIVNFSSVAGLRGVAGGSVYCVTKGAIVTMTKAWAVELAPHGLNVNCLVPGTVETPMNDALRDDPGFDAMTRGATPQGRNGKVDDVVPMIVFLSSEDAKWMNGSVVTVDGGWLA